MSTTTTTVSSIGNDMSSTPQISSPPVLETKRLAIDEFEAEEALELECGRERLKKHRVEVAGQVWIPDTWGQEDLLKDWIDCSVFNASLAPKGLMSAREALAKEQEGRRRSTAACCSSGLEVGTASC